MPEMRRVTVRFGESLWDLIEEEANRDGVSAAQWVRDASLVRALWERQRRVDSDGEAEILRLVREEHRAEDERRQLLIRDVLERARPELDALIAKLPPHTAVFVRELYGI